VPCTITYADGSVKEITLKCRIDTAVEIEYIEHGGVLHYVLRNLASCDLSRPGATDALVDDVLAHEGRIDALVNNAAGLEQGPDGGVTQAHRDMIEVNLTAPIALMDRMRTVMGQGGAIVNISSLNADAPAHGGGRLHRHEGRARRRDTAFARELGTLGIRVNAVAPGLIEKPEAPRPAEIVAMVVEDTRWAAPERPRISRGGGVPSVEDAGFITGQVLSVSGGYRL
jgi:3-oxoacyl-[acyl-carrier protein] reductase